MKEFKRFKSNYVRRLKSQWPGDVQLRTLTCHLLRPILELISFQCYFISPSRVSLELLPIVGCRCFNLTMPQVQIMS